MPRKIDLPFTAGQEVEATFTESGYRGAWFRCRVLDTAAAEPRLKLQFIDFPDEDDTWARVRVSNLAVKTAEPWLKKRRPLTWVVRPVAPVVHERDLDKYREDVRMGRKSSGHVHVYNDKYTVGDTVDWWKDDCFWGAQIVGINSKTNEAKIKLFLPPLGEGKGKMERASFKNLRPSFTWSPKYQWREQGNKQRKPRTGVENCNSDKPHIWGVHLRGKDSIAPAVMSEGSISSESTSSVRSEPEDNSTREERCKSDDFYELASTAENVYDRVKMRRKSIDGRMKSRKKSIVYKRRSECAIVFPPKQESPQEVKEEKAKRKVHFSFSDATSNSDGEEETSPKEEPEDIAGISKHGDLRNDSVANVEEETSPTEEREDIAGISKHGDSRSDSVANIEEDILKEKSTIYENGVSATCSTPCDAVVPELVGEKMNLPVESLGSCLTTENADGLGDQTGEVDGDDTSNQTHLTVSRDILENSPIADGSSDVAKALVCSALSEGGGAPLEEDSSTEMQNKKRSREESEDELEIPQKRLCPTNTEQGTALNDGIESRFFGSALKQVQEVEHRIENLRQPDIAAQVLNLGLEMIASRFNVGLKRKEVCDRDPEKDSKRIRADVEGTAENASVPASVPATVVELPRMRGAINLTEVPGKLRESRYLDPVIHGKERPSESVCFQQEQQQVKYPLCGHFEQIVLNSFDPEMNFPIFDFPTNSHPSTGSNLEIPSHNEFDSEVLNDKSENNKITLQVSYVIRDGKLVSIVQEKVGSTSTREVSFNVNRSSFTKEKGPEFSVSKEKPLSYNTLTESIQGIACKSSAAVVEPTAGIAIDANMTTAGVSSLNKTSGVSEMMNKVVESCGRELSIKGKASAGFGVESLSLLTTRAASLDSSMKEKVVNAIQSGGAVPIVKPEPQPVAAVSNPWVHDAVQCCIGKQALNRVSFDNFQTPEEIQVAAEVISALWQGVCCSSGLANIDLLQRIQLLSRMHFETRADGNGDKRKVIVSTGKPGEQLYLGHYETDTQFGVARKIVSRCKKELQKAFLQSGGVEMKQVPDSVLTEQHLRVTSGTAGPGMHTSTISRDFGPCLTDGRRFGQSLTRTEVLPKPSFVSGDSLRQGPCHRRYMSSEAAAGASGFLQGVIVLDDGDDEDEVIVIS